MEEKEFHRKLVQRYTENTITSEELEVFFHLLKEGKLDIYLADAMNKEAEISEEHERKFIPERIRRIPAWRRIAVAASVILVVSAGAYFLSRYQTNKYTANTNGQAQPGISEVLPGGNKAVLTLADGSRIVLDSAKDGVVAQQGNTRIIKPQAGQLAYDVSGSAVEIVYNTISTPAGGQYQVTLHDGSRVWLNAASSLRFPTSFSGAERKVEITGEAYFEVAVDKKKPFIVMMNDLQVEVLGTQFNLMAYTDEPAARTTLIEGSVKVKVPTGASILKPGEQASLHKNGGLAIETSIDTEQVTAWKNGLFHFKSADIETVMRQAIRWYDIEVNYEAVIDKHFSGTIPRNVTLTRMLKALELAGGVHFKLEGRKVTVTR